MVNTISFDWSENYNENGKARFNLECPNTEHHEKYGRDWETAYDATTPINGEEDETCEPYEGCPCCEDDSGNLAPMMNYLYPLDYQGLVTREIQIELAQTNCILVEEESTGDYFLTLTGGGMDLSPAIAWSYYKAQKWLPAEFLIQDVKAGWCKDSLSEKQFEELKAVVIDQLGNEKSRIDEQLKAWDKPTKDISQ